MKNVSIIIPTYIDHDNEQILSYLSLCLDSLFVDCKVKEVILIDNASKWVWPFDGYLDEKRDIGDLSDFQNLKVQRIEPPMRSFSEACNFGAKCADKDSEFLVFLNNDTVVSPGWLDIMIETYYNSPRTGIVGPWSNEIGGSQSIKVQPMSDKPYYTKLIKGVCMLVKKEHFFRLGGFDEGYKKWYQDDDLCMKFYSSGYHNVIAPTFVFHFGSMTFKALGIDLENDKEIKKDGEKFMEKWESKFKGSRV